MLSIIPGVSHEVPCNNGYRHEKGKFTAILRAAAVAVTHSDNRLPHHGLLALMSANACGERSNTLGDEKPMRVPTQKRARRPVVRRYGKHRLRHFGCSARSDTSADRKVSDSPPSRRLGTVDCSADQSLERS